MNLCECALDMRSIRMKKLLQYSIIQNRKLIFDLANMEEIAL